MVVEKSVVELSESVYDVNVLKLSGKMDVYAAE